MLTRQSEQGTEQIMSVATSSSVAQLRSESNDVQGREFVILAPMSCENTGDLGAVAADTDLHGKLLAGVQRLRGRIYSEDGALDATKLTVDGRHEQAIDRESWHIIALGPDGTVQGCLRYSPYSRDAEFNQLVAAGSALAKSDSRLRTAVQNEMGKARTKQVGFAEVGGWALSPTLRSSTAALDMLLLAFALLERLGSSLGICTATKRHGSASILQRVGLRSLEVEGVELPSYYDPQYQCEMEILRFDSSNPNPKYSNRLRNFQAQLSNIRVFCAGKKPATVQATFAMAA